MSHLGFCVLLTVAFPSALVCEVELPGWWGVLAWPVVACVMGLYAHRDGVI
jgi:hypothetical protein